jgi:hypothetical protein
VQPGLNVTRKRRALGEVSHTEAASRCALEASLPVYLAIIIPSALPGLAAVIAVCRAKQDDLPDIVRALMRIKPPTGERNRDRTRSQKHVPKP